MKTSIWKKGSEAMGEILQVNKLVKVPTKKLLEKNFVTIFTKFTLDIEENQAIIQLAYDNINQLKFIPSEQFQQEFVGALEEFEEKIAFLKNSLVPPCYNEELLQISTAVEQCNQKLRELDEQALMPNLKDDYILADKLVAKYHKVITEKNLMLKKLNRLRLESSEQAITNTSGYEYCLKLIEQLKELDIQIQQMYAVQENEADFARTFLSSRLSEIRPDIASKFLAQEYIIIKNDVNKLLGSEDRIVLRKFDQICKNVALFQISLKELDTAFSMEKLICQQHIKNIESMFSWGKYYAPVEYFKESEEASNIYLVKFLTSYCKNAYVDKMAYSLGKLKKLVVAEKFVEASKEVYWLTNYIEEAIIFANFEQERILKNLRLAIDIRNVMRELSYEAILTAISNDMSSGFKIYCVANTNTVTFEKIFVAKDDNVIISVCEGINTPWDIIRQKLAQKSIFIEPVVG